MSGWFAVVYAAMAGALTNVQVGADLRRYRRLHNRALTASVILPVGLIVVTAALLARLALAGVQLPTRDELAAIPWWAWAGGGLQGLTVLAVLLTAGRTGSAVFSALTVAGGAICSLLLDQFGLLGFDQHPINWNRVIGAALLVGGTVLTAR